MPEKDALARNIKVLRRQMRESQIDFAALVVLVPSRSVCWSASAATRS